MFLRDLNFEVEAMWEKRYYQYLAYGTSETMTREVDGNHSLVTCIACHASPITWRLFWSQEKETECRFWLIWDLNESKASLSIFNEKEVNPLMENVERENNTRRRNNDWRVKLGRSWWTFKPIFIISLIDFLSLEYENEFTEVWWFIVIYWTTCLGIHLDWTFLAWEETHVIINAKVYELDNLSLCGSGLH